MGRVFRTRYRGILGRVGGRHERHIFYDQLCHPCPAPLFNIALFSPVDLSIKQASTCQTPLVYWLLTSLKLHPFSSQWSSTHPQDTILVNSQASLGKSAVLSTKVPSLQSVRLHFRSLTPSAPPPPLQVGGGLTALVDVGRYPVHVLRL